MLSHECFENPPLSETGYQIGGGRVDAGTQPRGLMWSVIAAKLSWIIITSHSDSGSRSFVYLQSDSGWGRGHLIAAVFTANQGGKSPRRTLGLWSLSIPSSEISTLLSRNSSGSLLGFGRD